MKTSDTIIRAAGLGMYLALVLSFWVALTLYPTEAFMQDTRSKSYLVKLIGTREGWPEKMTDNEKRIMGEHFLYLKELTLKGKVLMAGPVFDEFGLIVLRVSGEDEAREIMAAEPSVAQGVHTYEMTEMVTSLMAHHVYQDRYPAEEPGRELVKEAVVNCTPAEAWHKWTTNDGAQTFFSSNTNIELRIGGPYEILFDMSAPPGSRGGEGNKVLSFLPERVLSFEWNAPPKFELLRQIRTRVILTFEPVTSDSTRVTLHHVGWGTDPGWDGVYDYFDNAWSSVMESFSKSFANDQ